MASDTSDSMNLYAELEVKATDDLVTIKKAYRRLVLKYHPDKNPEDKAKAEEKIRKINLAYETLGVPAKRQNYDAQASAMTAFDRGLHVDTALVQPRFMIPKAFMMCPMGHPDKFVRAAGKKLVVQSRADREDLTFDQFFHAAKFTLWWLNREDANNLCRLRTYDSNIVVNHDTSFGPPPGWVLGFNISASSTCADVMLCPHEQPTTTNVIAQASPTYPGAYRFESAFFSGCHIAYDPPDCVQMKMRDQPTATKAIKDDKEDRAQMKIRDQSSTIDFMLLDYACAEQHRTLNEVMIPVVMQLGGDKKHVPLMQVCRHTWIQKYFQVIMGGHFWDFDDFSFYFQAHANTWDYDRKNRALRLRTLEEQAVCALQKARNLSEVVHVVLIKASPDLTRIPLDAIDVGLTMFSKAKVAASETIPGCPIALQRLLIWLRQACKDTDGSSSVALVSLAKLWRPLADVGLTDTEPAVAELATEVKDAMVAHMTHLLELKDTAMDYSLLELVLEMPLVWEKCGEPLFNKGQQFIMKEGVEKLVPLLKSAATAKATKFGECLADCMMMKLLGVDAEVAMAALDAMVSGRFGLEALPMMLQTLLPKLPPAAAKDLQDRLDSCSKDRGRSRSRERRSKASE